MNTNLPSEDKVRELAMVIYDSLLNQGYDLTAAELLSALFTATSSCAQVVLDMPQPEEHRMLNRMKIIESLQSIVDKLKSGEIIH